MTVYIETGYDGKERKFVYGSGYYRKIYKQLIKLKLKNNKNDIRFDKKIDNIEYLYNLLDKNK